MRNGDSGAGGAGVGAGWSSGTRLEGTSRDPPRFRSENESGGENLVEHFLSPVISYLFGEG